MRRLTPFLLVSVPLAVVLSPVAGLASSPTATPIVTTPATPIASAGEPSVDVIQVEGTIDGSVAGYLEGALAQAARDRSTVVMELDSPGTLEVPPVALAQKIADSTVPVVVWVGPAPAQAAGAALLLMYASNIATVAPGAATGPLYPLDLGGGPQPGPAPLRRTIEGWLARHGRPTGVAFPDHPLNGDEAIRGNIVDYGALSLPDLLSKIDGTTVTTAAGKVTLDTKAAPGHPVLTRFHELGPVRRVLHAVAAPTFVYVLLVLGLAALAFELTQPGFGFAGFSGLGMVVLGGYGLTVVPVFWPGLALFLAAVGLLVADVQLRRLGILTALGLVVFVAGSFLAFRDVAPAIRLSPWLIGGSTIAAFLYYGFGLTVAVQSRERITSTQRGLIGLPGETRGRLSPEGPVFVKGTLWKGRSSNGPIPPGTKIRVRGVDGLILRVEPEVETGEE